MEAAPTVADCASAIAPKRRSQQTGCEVREATEADAPAVAAAVGELLVELSGGGPPASELEAGDRGPGQG